MDKFKTYLQNADLNLDKPSARVWANINAQIVQPKSKTIISAFTLFKYSVVACTIALACFGVWTLAHTPQVNFTTTNPTNSVATATSLIETDASQSLLPDTPFALVQQKFFDNDVPEVKANNDAKLQANNANTGNNIFKQIKTIDSQFSYALNVQKNIIRKIPIYIETGEYFKDFIASYKQMEQDENQVKQDMLHADFTDDMLEKLININEQKLNLLRLLQSEINKTNNRFKQNRNRLDTLKVYYLTM